MRRCSANTIFLVATRSGAYKIEVLNTPHFKDLNIKICAAGRAPEIRIVGKSAAL